MSEPTITCPSCQTRLRSTGTPTGKTLRCTRCGGQFKVADRAPAPPQSGSYRSFLSPLALGLLAGWAVAITFPLWVPAPPPGDGLRSLERSVKVTPPASGPKSFAPSITLAKSQRSPVKVVLKPSGTGSITPAKVGKDRPDAGTDSPIVLGRELFLREWVPGDSRSHGGDGLGPVFNDSSCAACHNLGGIGGGGPNGKNVDILSLTDRDLPQSQGAAGGRPGGVKGDPPSKIHPGFLTATSVVLHRFGNAPEYDLWRLDRLGMSRGITDPLEAQNIQNGPPEVLAKLDIERSRLLVGPTTEVPTAVQSRARSRPLRTPGAPVARSQRNTPALFGAGLIDTIPDGIIEAASRRSFPEFPGIRGRVSLLDDGKFGRFGWKGQMPTLREFVLTACAVEIGLEVPDHRQAGDPLQPDSLAKGLDLSGEECEALVAFVSSLPAPVRQAPTGADELRALREGKMTFLSVGCGTCHTPDLGKVEGIYSDLLLHDMGEDGGDTGSYRAFRPESPAPPDPSSPGPLVGGSPGRRRTGPGADRREWRTPPLWGVRDSSPYMHDGRADTLDQAIALHGGQGKDPATRYFGLSSLRQQKVRAFLKSLVAPVDPPLHARPAGE